MKGNSYGLSIFVWLGAAAWLPAQIVLPPPTVADWTTPPTPVIEPASLPDRGRVQIDYVYWFIQKMRVPPLVTSGPMDSGGVPGQPGVSIVHGGNRLESRHDDRYIGVRVSGDWWWDAEQTWGLDGSFFFLERDSSYFTLYPMSHRLLARPYVNAVTNRPEALVIAGPRPGLGFLEGAIVCYSRIELFGQDANLMASLARGSTWQINGLLGARFFQLRERVDVTAASWVLPDRSTQLGQSDHFWTFNRFYGGQVGLKGDWTLGRLRCDGEATVGLGANDTEINVKGENIFHTPFERRTVPYGLYALPSNLGRHTRTDLDVVGELGLNVSYQLTRHFSLRAGYNYLFWSGPSRPGDQLDVLNLGQVTPGGSPRPQRPTIAFREDFFWAHGFNVGGEWRW